MGKKNKFSFIKPADRKTLQQKETNEVKVQVRKKEKVVFFILIFIQFSMQLV